MDPEHESEADDEQLGELLEAYDTALASGCPAETTAPAELSAVLRTELEGLQACLRRLERAWPRQGSSRSGLSGGPSAADPGWYARPARLGRYELVRLLGAGGFGLVYLAWDPQLRREVAIKVPRPEALLTPSARGRFLREAQTAAGLTHPNLVPVYEVGEAGPAVYLVSAYCPGPTLEAWLNEHPEPVPPRAAAELLACLADAVHYIHTQGILHRDLKPANILLQRSETTKHTKQPEAHQKRALQDSFSCVSCVSWFPKITDFGLAKDLDRETQLTRSGAAVGTPAYMAPEQAEGRAGEVGPATDVYALGAILYRVLTGRVPFLGANAVDTVRRIAIEEPLEPRRLRPDVPRDLETLCLRCLEKDPRRRYPSAQALADDLGRFLAGRPIQARPVGNLERLGKWLRRRPAVAALVGVCTLALVGSVLAAVLYSIQLGQHNAELQATLQRERDERERADERQQQVRRHSYARQFRFAAQVWRTGPTERALEILNDLHPAPGEKDLRGFEWSLLKGACPPCPSAWEGHAAAVMCVAVSRDGKIVATGGLDGTVRLWDPATGRLRSTFRRRPQEVIDIAFAPDGQTLAWMERYPSQVVLWDLVAGRERVRYDAGKGSRLAFSPDGRTVVMGCLPGLGFCPVAGDQPPTYRDKDQCWDCVAVSPDGRLIARGGYPAQTKDKFRVCLYDVQVGREGPVLGEHQSFIWALAFSPDGRALASGGWDTQVKVWDVGTGQLRTTLGEPHHEVVRTAFSPDGRLLAWAGRDVGPDRKLDQGYLRLWDLVRGQRVPLSRERFPKAISSLAFSPDGTTLFLACMDSQVYVVPTGQFSQQTLPGHAPAEAWSLAFSPDGRTLASAGDDHQVRLWDAATGRERAVLRGHDALVTTVAWAPDGRTIASASFDQTVRLWDAATGRPQRTLPASGRLKGLAFSPDGTLLAAGTGPMSEPGQVDTWGAVQVWEAATGRERVRLEDLNARVYSVVFSPNGEALAAASGDGTIRLWDTATWQPRTTLTDTAEVWCLAFSPDGSMLASGNKDKMVRLWDVAAGKQRVALPGHTAGIEAVAFSPDGRTIASAGYDQTVRLWQAATGEELLVLQGHSSRVNAVAFSPDGKVLASASHDGMVKFWRAAEFPSPP